MPILYNSVTQQEFTISMWIFPNVADERWIINTNSNLRIRLSSASNLELFDDSDEADLNSFASSGTINLNSWNFITMSYSLTSGNLTLSLNSVVETQAYVGTHKDVSLDGLGTFNDLTFFEGKMEDVKIFNKVLTAGEITDYFNNQTFDYRNRSVLDLPMGAEQHDPTNTRTLDVGRNASHGTLSGVVKLAKKGYTFDGVDDYLEIAHADYQLGSNLTNGFTISAWIRIAGVGESNNGRILDKSDDVTSGNGFYWRVNNATPTGVTFQINGGTARNGANTLTHGNSAWYHVLLTVSSAQLINFYYDGTLSGTADQDLVQTISTITTTNVMRVGNRSSATDRSFDGDIRLVKMFDFVLSPIQIKDLYKKELHRINDE